MVCGANVPRDRRAVVRTSRLTGIWTLGYALYRAYYAAGGTIGMHGTPVSVAEWRRINAIGALTIPYPSGGRSTDEQPTYRIFSSTSRGFSWKGCSGRDRLGRNPARVASTSVVGRHRWGGDRGVGYGWRPDRLRRDWQDDCRMTGAWPGRLATR